MRRKPAKRRFVSVVITVLLAALILSLAGSLSIASAVSFSDVPSSSPYYKAITDLAGRGIISGYSNGKFGPNDPVTRQQFAKMIVLSLGLSPKEGDYPDPSVRFVDLGTDTSSLYPHEFVATAALNGLTNGTDATHFSPLRNISRSQVVTMVKRAGGSGKTPSGYSSSGNATRAEVAWMLYTMRNEPRTEVTVSAASSLKGAFTAIGAAFDKSHHTKTVFNFDASGTLQKQIESGANVDVFASAATKQTSALLGKGLAVESSLRYFASNEICLVVPANSTLGLTSFMDLTKSIVKKVGYGDPAVAPHGVAAEEILKTLGVFSTVKPKVVYAANVSQATEWVVSGVVDAGIVFTTEAQAAGSKMKVVAVSKPAWHSTITYPIVAISGGKHLALSTAFCDYVKGSLGQEVLQSYGFKKYGY
jgi:molybdate transport system substrate-binding protein